MRYSRSAVGSYVVLHAHRRTAATARVRTGSEDTGDPAAVSDFCATGLRAVVRREHAGRAVLLEDGPERERQVERLEHRVGDLVRGARPLLEHPVEQALRVERHAEVQVLVVL